MALRDHFMALGLPVLLALWCPGCGGAQVQSEQHDNPHARALEAALRSGAAVDRDLFGGPVKIGGMHDWESPSAALGQDGPAWYNVFARLYGGRLHVEEITIEREAVDRVLRPDSPGNVEKAPSGASVGTGTTIVGLPPEFGFWLALADLYRQPKVESKAAVKARGFGTTAHQQNSKEQGRETLSAGHSNLSALRDLVQFRVSPDVVCAGQFKRFQIDEKSYLSPADEAERRLLAEDRGRKDMYERREALGLHADAKGQVSWRMGQEADSTWVLRVHMALDAEEARFKGEVMDESLICRSAKPLLARELPGYLRRVTRAEQGTWKVEVWRGGGMPAVAQPTLGAPNLTSGRGR